MELRAVARRCPSRSMTVLGDLAQATAPAPSRAGPTRSCTSARRPPRRSRSWSSATGCRRRSSTSPTACCPTVAPACGRPGRCASTARLRSWCRRRPTTCRPRTAAEVRALAAAWSSVGVVVPERWRDAVADALGEAGVDFGTGTRGGLDARRHPPRPARGQGPRVRRRRGGGAERDPHRRAGRPPPLHRPHPGGAGARHRPRRARCPPALAA